MTDIYLAQNNHLKVQKLITQRSAFTDRKFLIAAQYQQE